MFLKKFCAVIKIHDYAYVKGIEGFGMMKTPPQSGTRQSDTRSPPSTTLRIASLIGIRKNNLYWLAPTKESGARPAKNRGAVRNNLWHPSSRQLVPAPLRRPEKDSKPRPLAAQTLDGSIDRDLSRRCFHHSRISCFPVPKWNFACGSCCTFDLASSFNIRISIIRSDLNRSQVPAFLRLRVSSK